MGVTWLKFNRFELNAKNLNYFLQKGEVLPYHLDPTIQEAGNILFTVLLLVVSIWFIKVLRSIPKADNALDARNGIEAVSPFLIVENEEGSLGFEGAGRKRIYKVMALVLIIIFTLVPLVTIADSELGWLYAFYY